MKENSTSNTSAQMLGKALTVLVVLLSFWFIYQQIKSSDIDIFETLFNAKPIIFMSIICIFGVLILSPIIWKFLMLGSGANVPYRLCFGIWWTTNIAKYVPGKVSLIAGRTYVARKYGSKVVLESFVWELIISVSSAVIAGLFLIELDGISSSMKWILVFVGIASLFPILSPKLTQDLVRKPFSLLGRGDWNHETSMTRRFYCVALILMIVSWLLWGLAHKFILLGLGVDASLPLLIGSFAIAWLVGFFAFFLPAGFGAREGVFTFNLSLFLSGGIAGIVAIVSRTLNVLIEIIAFVFGLTMMSSEELEEE
ncbi:MAG: lysylphosphatidylglycerol synthase domain-containing protein [Candidatus Poseidoniaceae archaeon]